MVERQLVLAARWWMNAVAQRAEASRQVASTLRAAPEIEQALEVSGELVMEGPAVQPAKTMAERVVLQGPLAPTARPASQTHAQRKASTARGESLLSPSAALTSSVLRVSGARG